MRLPLGPPTRPDCSILAPWPALSISPLVWLCAATMGTALIPPLSELPCHFALAAAKNRSLDGH
jgi:hypothetical protein